MAIPNVLSTVVRKLTGLRGAERFTYRYGVLALAPELQQSIDIVSHAKPFLITSTGRTGTTWLAGLLNQIPDTCVVHEPVPWEQVDHVSAISDPSNARDHLTSFRLRDMAYRIQTSGASVYGEVNAPIRRHVRVLRELVPAFRTIHVIRNGRQVVTSIMNRSSFTAGDSIYAKLRLPESDISAKEWENMDRFSKIAWLWAYDNCFLRENCEHLAKFEDMLSSYSAFKSQILNPLGFVLDEDVWKSVAQFTLNATKNPRFSCSDWTDEQERTFEHLCGEEMRRYGYH